MRINPKSKMDTDQLYLALEVQHEKSTNGTKKQVNKQFLFF